MTNIEFVLHHKEKNFIYDFGLVTLGPGYSFTFPDLLAGTYDLYAKGEYKYVRIRIDDVELRDDVEGQVVEFVVTGDVDGNNVVNEDDSDLLAAAWMASPASSHWNSNADLDCNEFINTFDLNLYAAYSTVEGVSLP